MEIVGAFMFLLACSEDLSTCASNPEPGVAYATVTACEGDMEKTMSGHKGPQVLAYCWPHHNDEEVPTARVFWDGIFDRANTAIAWNLE